jgi:hypothetical protein
MPWERGEKLEKLQVSASCGQSEDEGDFDGQHPVFIVVQDRLNGVSEGAKLA